MPTPNLDAAGVLAPHNAHAPAFGLHLQRQLNARGQADLFVVPSLHDSSSKVVLEALSHQASERVRRLSGETTATRTYRPIDACLAGAPP
jgi:hypothetical protein